VTSRRQALTEALIIVALFILAGALAGSFFLAALGKFNL
jgi:hypothetical protein